MLVPGARREREGHVEGRELRMLGQVLEQPLGLGVQGLGALG
ncbi:MAG TPA: hypothetical protein VHT29_07185 [Solirubrobacteraceae bacterium]|nr:hypothetical protein [Solirubrobacteraceae bacterium]